MSRFIHGHRNSGSNTSATYNSWKCMKRRCDDPKHTSYKVYGGRGITYDPRWKKFEAFLNDMGERPLGYDLSRKDQDGNYCFDNCEWLPERRNRGYRRHYKSSGKL